MRKHTIRLCYTLIELLVTISIVAILAGILLPALSSAQRTVRKVTCCANLKQIGIASVQYAGSYHDYFAPPMIYKGSSSNWNASFYFWDFHYGVNFLSGTLKRMPSGYDEPYGSTWEVFRCPDDKKQRNSSDETLVQLPPRSYGMIRPLFDGGSASNTPPKSTSIKKPSRTYFIAECNLNEAVMNSPVCGRAQNYTGCGSVVYIDKSNRIGLAHKKETNMLYADGHATSIATWNGYGKSTTLNLTNIEDVQ